MRTGGKGLVYSAAEELNRWCDVHRIASVNNNARMMNLTKKGGIGSKALVLDILWWMCAADRIAQEQFAPDKPFALIEGHPLSGVSKFALLRMRTPKFDKEFTRHRHSS
jgi:hypothetical protein